jgi:RHS repeat-associated protein
MKAIQNGIQMKALRPTGSQLSRSYEMNVGLQNYGMRMYDNSIGRFTTTDRFADKYATMSPYQYGANNPIKYIDVNGDNIRVCNQVWTPGATYKGNDKFT